MNNDLWHRIIVHSTDADVVERYLPANYKIMGGTPQGRIIVEGTDDHGWTAEGYVIPRLASAMILAELA